MSKILVAYFSPGGTTAAAAKALAQAAGADLYEIRPEVPYTRPDLDWTDKNSRSSREMGNLNSRPALADRNADIAGHDIIFLGFPIWWYVAPTILFATSGGSGFGKAAAGLRVSVSPDTRIEEGTMLNGRPTAARLKTWLEKVL